MFEGIFTFWVLFILIHLIFYIIYLLNTFRKKKNTLYFVEKEIRYWPKKLRKEEKPENAVAAPVDSLESRFERVKENRPRFIERQKETIQAPRAREFDPVAAVDEIFSRWKDGDKASKLSKRASDERKRQAGEDWDYIERLNAPSGINRENAYIDDKGYLRWKGNGRLCHRDVAFKKVRNETGLPFGQCDVHHVDGNKCNDNPSNLKILKRKEHQVEHGQILFFEGKKFTRFARRSKIYKETPKSIMIARRWIQKSDSVVKGGYVYVTNRVLKQFGKESEPETEYVYPKDSGHQAERKCGRTTCTGCEFYNEFDRVCQK